jgi:rhodanese-related sulfurtransferase
MLTQGLSLAAFVLLCLTACSQNNGATLSAPDAYARAEAGKLTLIDVRRADEWRQTGVAKGALHIDMTGTQGETGFVRQVTRSVGGNMRTPIGLLSLSGNRAANARDVLRAAGFTEVYVIPEGMQGNGNGPGWIERGLPMEPCPDC